MAIGAESGKSTRAIQADIRRTMRGWSANALATGPDTRVLELWLKGVISESRNTMAVPSVLKAATPLRETSVMDVVTESPQVAKEKSPQIDPLGTVTLGMYAPEDRAKITPLVKHYAGGASVDAMALLGDEEKLAKREARRKKRVQARTGISSQDYDKQRATELEDLKDIVKQRINQNVYKVIQDGLGLSTEEAAADKFEASRQYANNAVKRHAALLYQGVVKASLRNEVALPQKPGDLLDFALSPNADDKVLPYEIKRQTLDTIISLHQERGISREADYKLTQIQNLFNHKLYAGKIGATDHMSVYGHFDSSTNRLLGDPFFTPPTEVPKTGSHYKEMSLPVRTLKNGTRVLTLMHTKSRDSAIGKAKRRAKERADRGEDDTVHVGEDVQDTHRMKIVVVDSQQNLDPQRETTQVAEVIFNMITDPANSKYLWNRDVSGKKILGPDGQPTGTSTGKGDIRFVNRGSEGQSKEYNVTKIEAEFSGITNPIKISVATLKDYINSELLVGEDLGNGKYSGPAHEILELLREFPLEDTYHKTIYPDLVRPSEYKENPIHPLVRAKVDELRERDKMYVWPKTDS